MLKNTNGSAKTVSSTTCLMAPPPNYGYSLLDPTQPQLPYVTTFAPALSYLPFPAAAPAAPPGALPAHLAALPLPPGASTQPPLPADYNAAAAGAGGANGGGGLDPAFSYSNTSSFTVAASPCLPMFFSSETSFQLSTSPCPSDANLTASQVGNQSIDQSGFFKVIYM